MLAHRQTATTAPPQQTLVLLVTHISLRTTKASLLPAAVASLMLAWPHQIISWPAAVHSRSSAAVCKVWVRQREMSCSWQWSQEQSLRQIQASNALNVPAAQHSRMPQSRQVPHLKQMPPLALLTTPTATSL